MGSELEALVPYFIVSINGSRLAVDQEASVKKIVVKDRIDAPSICTITFSDTDRTWVDSSEFSEGQEVEVKLGYKDSCEPVFSGDITAVRASFNRNSDDVTTLICHNAIHRLQRVKKTTTYVDKSDSEIIEEIASDHSLQANCDSMGEARPFVVQKGITDYDFVMQLARYHGCRVWVDKKDINVRKTPPDAGDLVVEWQKTLMEFDVTMDTNGMHTNVEVRSWDPQSASEIVGTADPGSVSKKIGGSKLGSKLVKDAFGEAKLVVIDPDLKDKKAADDMAADLMTKSSLQFIRGVGRCEGNNKFKAGGTVNIKEVGDKFEGDYLILEVDHQFSAVSGYTTGFTVQRNAMG